MTDAMMIFKVLRIHYIVLTITTEKHHSTLAWNMNKCLILEFYAGIWCIAVWLSPLTNLITLHFQDRYGSRSTPILSITLSLPYSHLLLWATVPHLTSVSLTMLSLSSSLSLSSNLYSVKLLLPYNDSYSHQLPLYFLASTNRIHTFRPPVPVPLEFPMLLSQPLIGSCRETSWEPYGGVWNTSWPSWSMLCPNPGSCPGSCILRKQLFPLMEPMSMMRTHFKIFLNF